MKKLNVTITCMAVYNSQIEVPDDATLEEAIEIAKENIKDIPLGELEYVPDSDILDEENCDFENENEDEDEDDWDFEECIEVLPEEELTEEQGNIVRLWDKFDEVMKSEGYKLTVIAEDVRDEEREMFGKPLSTLSSVAYKDDDYCAKIKLIIDNDINGFTLVVYEGNGTNMVTTKEVGRMTFSEYTEESLLNGINVVLDIFGDFNKDNPIPKNWERTILT